MNFTMFICTKTGVDLFVYFIAHVSCVLLKYLLTEPSPQGESKELVNTAPSKVDTSCHKKKATPYSKSAHGDKWTKKQCKEKIGTGRQERDHYKKDEACQSNFNKENICLLDATREGNVGRFLNVSNNSIILLDFWKSWDMILHVMVHNRHNPIQLSSAWERAMQFQGQRTNTLLP